MTLHSIAIALLTLAQAPGAAARQAQAAPPSLSRAAQQIEAAAPTATEHLKSQRTIQLAKSASELESAAAKTIFLGEEDTAAEMQQALRELLESKALVDRALDKTLDLRTQFVRLREGAARRETIRQFLQTTTTLIDLSGRLRYLLRDAIDTAAYVVASERVQRLALLDLLIEYRSGIGAGVMAVLLEDPPASSGAKGVDDYVKGKVLQLIAASDESDLLPQVAKLIQDEKTTPPLVVLATQCVRRLGLPQSPHRRQDKTLPPPAITAGPLYQRLAKLQAASLSPRSQAYRRELLDWLKVRMTKGVVEDRYRFFGHELREGDWLLMRNPSPYNLFTDLSPGMFTHVGVVTTDVGEDGVRRFVLVDLPERGATIPVTNVDTYILRTLHYFFLRHPDQAVGQRMGEAARQMIGNPTQFDLTFRTRRVDAYRDVPLAGKTVHTYCAGFLLICAQRTGRPREEFFPIIEYPAPGKTRANLKSLGLAMGEDFVSPTAALFSPQLKIVGRRRPMYDPSRQIKESIFDHFAQQMRGATLHQSPNAKQAIRQRLAEISTDNAWLRAALAKATGVSEKMDLVSAARAAAVVESLDEIADGSAAEFEQAREAFYAVDSLEQPRRAGTPAARIEKIEAIRRQHEKLYASWSGQKLTPHQLQTVLIEYYTAAGRRRLDERFFRLPK